MAGKRCYDKDCAHSGLLLPLARFGADRHAADGHNRRCKECIVRNCHVSRGRTKLDRIEKSRRKAERTQQRVDRANVALDHHSMHGFIVEWDAIRLLQSEAWSRPPCGCEFHQLHDGTKSDFALRFGRQHDLWLPQQLKSCSASEPPFKFCNCDKEYECGIVCVAPYATPPRIFAYTSDFVAKNQDAMSGSDIRIGVRHSVWSNGETSMDAYFERMCVEWLELCNTSPLRILELQCNRNAQLEYCLAELAELLDEGRVFEQPSVRNGVVDRLMDGQRVQDKCARRPSGGCIGLTARVAHTGSYVAYLDGDNDLYCIHHVTSDGRLYIQWMIPQSELLSREIVSELGPNGKVTKAGSGVVTCHVATRSERVDQQRVKLQYDVCGGFPRKNSSTWTAAYCRVMTVPPWFEWPTGVLGTG
mgnify:CR=1 FL=1